MRYRYYLILDTEFVSSRQTKQPLQIAIQAYEWQSSAFVKVKDFSSYIFLKKGNFLNQHVRQYTKINESVLKEKGIRFSDARLQLIHFLLEFPFHETVVIGWDPSQDIVMLNLLLNDSEQMLDIRWYDWMDLASAVRIMQGIPKHLTPSLEKACALYELPPVEFHDADDDAMATAKLFFALNPMNNDEKLCRSGIIKKSTL